MQKLGPNCCMDARYGSELLDGCKVWTRIVGCSLFSSVFVAPVSSRMYLLLLRSHFGSSTWNARLPRPDTSLSVMGMASPPAVLAAIIRRETRALSPEDVANYIHALELSAEELAAAYHRGDLPYCALILPGGLCQGMRKDLSHRGMLELKAERLRVATDWFDTHTQAWYRDPTNLVYGCAGRYLNQFLVPHSSLSGALCQLGDEKIGDVFEALLGIAWLSRIRDPLAYEFSREKRTTSLIERFVWNMIDLLETMRRNNVTRDLGNSRFFADFLRAGMHTASSALHAEQVAHPQKHGDAVGVTHLSTNLTQSLPCARRATEAANVGIVTLAPGDLKSK